MSPIDKCIIDAFIPTIINRINIAGYLVEEAQTYELINEGIYKYHFKIIISRCVPYNVYVPSFLIAPYAQMLESVAVSVLIGRGAENKPVFKVSEFAYIPSSQYLQSFTSMASKIKDLINYWVEDIRYTLNAEELALENSAKIKNELFQRTFKPELLVV